eukprot:jgi/Psemu1/28462/gm1.28462_g
MVDHFIFHKASREVYQNSLDHVWCAAAAPAPQTPSSGATTTTTTTTTSRDTTTATITHRQSPQYEDRIAIQALSSSELQALRCFDQGNCGTWLPPKAPSKQAAIQELVSLQEAVPSSFSAFQAMIRTHEFEEEVSTISSSNKRHYNRKAENESKMMNVIAADRADEKRKVLLLQALLAQLTRGAGPSGGGGGGGRTSTSPNTPQVTTPQVTAEGKLTAEGGKLKRRKVNSLQQNRDYSSSDNSDDSASSSDANWLGIN